jgi:hypothetical protein
MSNRDIIDRSRRHHLAETAGAPVYIPGQTIGHPGGAGGSSFIDAYCKTDAADKNFIVCYKDYDELNVRVWRTGVTYVTGDIVTNNNKFYLYDLSAWAEITAYNEATTYNITTAVWTLYNYKLWRSLQTGNINHTPTEGVWWTTKAKAYAAGTAYVAGNRCTHTLTANAWVNTTTYAVGAHVSHSGRFWRSRISGNVGHTPAEGGYWTEVTSCLYVCTTAGAGISPTQTPAVPPVGAATTRWQRVEELEVYCNIAGGNQLNFAFPLLYEQQRLKIEYNATNTRYEALTLFQAAEESCAEGGMLELVSLQLSADHVSSTDYVSCGLTPGRDLLFDALAYSTYVIDLSIMSTQTGTGKISIDGPADTVQVAGNFIFGTTITPITAYLNDVSIGSTAYARGELIIQTGVTAGLIRFVHKGTTIKAGSNMRYRRINYAAGTL